MPSLKEAALHYAELGFAVFPLLPKSKAPATAHGFHDASKSPGTVEAWWIQNPNYNIGIACGQESHLVVIDVDVDPDKGKDGQQTIRDWEREHGTLPPTWMVITGRGGAHYWYRTDEKFKNAVDILPAVDIRSDGGYVVAPPSIHPNGSTYEWEVLSDPKFVKIADLKGSALEILQIQKERKPKEDKYSENNVIHSGSRVKLLLSLEGSLVNLGLTPEAIMAAVRAENDAKCDPPLDEYELQKEVFPFLSRGIEPADPWTDTILPETTLITSDFPEPVALSQIWNSPPPLAPALIDGVLRQGHKMIISGPSKAGKSYMLIELAFSIAEGMNWCGARCRQGKVFYVNMEIDNPSFYKRFKEVYHAYGMNVDIHTDNVVTWGLRGHSKPITELAPMIIEKTKGKGFSAIIIDPLYKVIQGDENSNSDIAEMSKGFDRIAAETGCSVIYAHHFSKGFAGDKASIDRGSGAGTFSRDPDAILTVTQLDLDDSEKSAWRVEFTLREFPNKDPVDVWWEYPIHRLDPYLNRFDVMSALTAGRKKQKKAADAERSKEIDQIVDDLGGEFTTREFMNNYDENVSKWTVERRLRSAGYIKVTEQDGKAGKWHKE